MNSRYPNTNSSKDSGLGRSSSNNEGETSVDESINDGMVTKVGKEMRSAEEKKKEEDEVGYGSSQPRKSGDRSEKPLPIDSLHVAKPTEMEVEEEAHPVDLLREKTLKYIYTTFDGGGNGNWEEEKHQDQPSENERLCNDEAPEKITEIPLQADSKEGHHGHHNPFPAIESSIGRGNKKPPDENESYSGDSSEKPPPHPLPKLVKGKGLMVGQKRTRHCMSQKMMNETQEMQELSNSTGSDCDEGPHAKRPLHQKPHKMLVKPRPSKLIQKALQERNMKRTKILKRKESSGMKAKALLHHQPTPEDISNLLKEFTLDFMLNGYSTLVQGLRMQVLLPYQMDLDKSHLLWLITYFLRFAVELDLELSQICPVLSTEVSQKLNFLFIPIKSIAAFFIN